VLVVLGLELVFVMVLGLEMVVHLPPVQHFDLVSALDAKG
jgi:hypothetical protein